MNLRSPEKKSPLITIVIPTFNEVENIEVALQHILENGKITNDLEVLLIDGGSTDGTVLVASCFSDRLNLNVIHAPGSSVYKALNIGLSMARGEYFVRVDARSAIPSNYIAEVINNLELPDVECAGGIQAQYGNSLVSNSIAWVTKGLVGTGGAKFRVAKKSGFVDSVYLGAYRTATLRSFGGFEDGGNYVSEDSYINMLIRESGKKIYLNAGLKISYPAKSNFKQLIRQYFIYGAAKGFLIRKHKKFTSPRQVIPLLFFFTIVVLVILSLADLISFRILGILFLVYCSILFFGNLVLDKQKRKIAGNIWARCLATLCIHLAWPIGFYTFIFSPAMHKRLIRWL